MSDPTSPGAEALLRANRDFYRAFASGDYVAMDRLWADHHALTCVHPGWDTLRGRERVMASWRGILRRPLPVRSRDEVVTVVGELGIIVCVEILPEGELAATNVFVIEGGRWRMLHHHAGLIARSFQRDEDADDEPDSDESGSGRLLN